MIVRGEATASPLHLNRGIRANGRMSRKEQIMNLLVMMEDLGNTLQFVCE